MDGSDLQSKFILRVWLASTYNSFYSALSPTAPFPKETPRLKLAGVLVPAVAVALLTTSATFMKMSTAGIGFGFFGNPIIWRGLDLLNKKVPDWQKYLEIRKYVQCPGLLTATDNFSALCLKGFRRMHSSQLLYYELVKPTKPPYLHPLARISLLHQSPLL